MTSTHFGYDFGHLCTYYLGLLHAVFLFYFFPIFCGSFEKYNFSFFLFGVPLKLLVFLMNLLYLRKHVSFSTPFTVVTDVPYLITVFAYLNLVLACMVAVHPGGHTLYCAHTLLVIVPPYSTLPCAPGQTE